MTTQWIMDIMEDWAPTSWAMETDNVGLIVGDRDRPVSRVLTALDLSESVLREAVQGRFDFVVTHHPLITRHSQPINSITAENVLGKKIMTLIGHGIGLYCAHTNLDVAPGGVGEILFDLAGLQDKEMLVKPKYDNFPTLGLIGRLPQPMLLVDFAREISKALNTNLVRYVGQDDMQISKVGLCAGNGTSPQLIAAALENKCDAYITGDVGYHLGMNCIESGMALIDGTHYATEIFIAKAIVDYLKNAAERHGFDLTVQQSQTDGQVFRST